ncbi:DCN1-like protein 1 [Tetrabaena socialis]|uniref:Defective in cullin neddylation protein n=1 Tax=Tetrabaena socialis TaxID=47790 RepID=A0A2J8ABM5_9CHLO|nr:DCN1-like protein 1 [Tetrabaena socialis]|eukprot:PNH09928.1 DCN1-like protein 1 [Tetrabaena socialis]
MHELESGNRLTKPQKDKIVQFRSITGSNEKVAGDCLKQAGWGVEAAIDHFYSAGLAAQPASTTGGVDLRAIEALYQRYKDPGGDSIGVNGITTFCEDLEVDPTDLVVLVICYYMSAAVMCEYSKEEFTGGLVKLGVDSVDKLKRRLPELRAELRAEAKFREVYSYAYNFSREKGQKCVQLDTAVGMWRLLFSVPEQHWPLIDDWCDFLTQHHNRAISKDTWLQLFDFIKSVKPDFSNFDENSAWPYLIDEFVDHMKAKRGK